VVRLSRYLITLPVMLLPLVAAGARPGLADAAGVEQGVEILARAKAADSRCHILSEGERDELGRYAARAEIAAASRISVTAARTARSRGDAAGSAADCGATVATDVRDTLAAAREAIAAHGRKPRPEISAATAASVADRGPPAGAPGLARYGRLAEAYYVERRCRHLSRGDADRFWRAIVRMHKLVLVSNGTAAVAPVLRRAERQSHSPGCGEATYAEVKAGFQEIQTR